MSQAALHRLFPLLAIAGLCLLAQSGRDNYRNLYRAWREGDPSLESDAGNAPADALASRAAKAAGLAAAYGSAHSGVLKDLSQQQAANLQWLSTNSIQLLPDLAPAPDEVRFANRESSAVAGGVAAFANDPDPGIQKLRQAFQREATALDALKTSIVDRQQAEDKALKAVSTVEVSRSKAIQEYTFLSSALMQSSDAMNQELAAWATYYSKLGDAGRTAPPPPAVSTSTAAPPAGATASAAPPRAPSVTPLPLVRYVGVWSYRPGSPFFGSTPEVVDFTVHEENGHATGTFYARFKLPPGSPGDPVLRFDFAGEFKNSRTQTFPLTTDDGITGTVDLNPGVAFNELEINFNTQPRQGKVTQGDMLLLKQ